MPRADRAGLPVVLLSLGTLGSTLVAFAAMAAGGMDRYGTASAGERQTLIAAACVAVLCAVTLVVMAVQGSESIGPSLAAMAGFVAAFALSVPAVYAFSLSVSTPIAEAVGCGTISTPTVAVQRPFPADDPVAASCRNRLNNQKVVVAALAIPSLLGLCLSVETAFRRRERAEPRSVAVGG